jgi:hypothetical protein
MRSLRLRFCIIALFLGDFSRLYACNWFMKQNVNKLSTSIPLVFIKIQRYCEIMHSSVVLGFLLSFSQAAPVPLNLGVHHLVDASLLSGETNGTYFALGDVQKDLDHPLVTPEYPWENAVHFYTSLLFLPSNISSTGRAQWLLYYACADDILFFNPIGLCVANSSDSVVWAKPLLNIHPYDKNGTISPVPTNIVFITESNTFGLQVFLDSKASVTMNEQVVLAYEALTSGQRYLKTAISSDGIHFTPSMFSPADSPAIPYSGFADTMASVFYDKPFDRYVAIGRNDIGLDNTTQSCPGANPVFRELRVTIKNCDSKSVCNVSDENGWGPFETILKAGFPDVRDCVDNYNPSALSVDDAGTGSLYILLPSVIRHIPLSQSGAPDTRAGANDGFMDIRLATSRNAINFTFPSRNAFIHRGIGSLDPLSGLYNSTGSDRDAGFVFATNTGLLDPDLALDQTPSTPSNYVSIFYWGSQTTHAGGGAYLYRYWPDAFTGIFRAKMRREGWVSLSTNPNDLIGAGSARTIALLLPIPTPGKGLFLSFNACVDAAGVLSIAILSGETLEPISGFNHNDCSSLYGNGVRQLLNCSGAGASGDLSALALKGEPVVLDLLLTHAKVYSWSLDERER